MNNQSAQRAIKAALSGNWDEAIEFNLQALKSDPADTDTLNRLARAYVAIGQTKNAHKVWNKVLHLDPYNPIALQQVAKLKHRNHISASQPPISANTFIDEPGKTKTVTLTRRANTTLLLGLEPGQPVDLSPKKRSIEVLTQDGKYLGALADDLSAYLIKLIKAGNKYDALVRRVGKNSVHIFLKETKRSKRHQNTPSFPSQTPISTYEFETHAPIIESPIDIAPTGEEGEQ